MELVRAEGGGRARRGERERDLKQEDVRAAGKRQGLAQGHGCSEAPRERAGAGHWRADAPQRPGPGCRGAANAPNRQRAQRHKTDDGPRGRARVSAPENRKRRVETHGLSTAAAGRERPASTDKRWIKAARRSRAAGRCSAMGRGRGRTPNARCWGRPAGRTGHRVCGSTSVTRPGASTGTGRGLVVARARSGGRRWGQAGTGYFFGAVKTF